MLFFVLPAVGTTAAENVLFVPLGDISGGSFDSTASGCSDVNRVVVGKGTNASDEGQAVMWQVTDDGSFTMTPIVGAGEGPSGAAACSPEGSMTVGNGEPPSATARQAFRQTEASGVEWLDNSLYSEGRGSARCVSRDGTVYGEIKDASDDWQPVYWTAGTTDAHVLEDKWWDSNKIFGCSSDGTYLVGRMYEPAKWTWNEGTGEYESTELPHSDTWGRARDISEDGQFVVGSTNSGGDYKARRWDGMNNPVDLGKVDPAHTDAHAKACTDDGQIAVGRSDDDGADRRAWVCTFDDSGNPNLVPLADYAINDMGLEADELTGWTLSDANDISDDGSMIVGAGINPSGDREAFAIVDKDVDGDGMTSAWEEDYGLDPTDPADADDDPDMDGHTNLHEYLQGSDPTLYVLHLEPGWNDVSLGRVPTDNSLDAIFGAMIIPPAWVWEDGTYKTTDTIGSLGGHWIYYSGDTPVNVEIQLP